MTDWAGPRHAFRIIHPELTIAAGPIDGPPTISQIAQSRIFLVDDHPLVREWVAGLVAKEPDLAICGHAADAPATLAAFARDRPDLVLIDLSLNGSSGMDLIRDLHAQFPSVQFMVLSMHEESSIAERAFRAGARGYVLKRESTMHVIDGMRSVLAGRFYVSPTLMSALAGRMLGGVNRPAGSPVETLSARELEVFQLRGEGRMTKEIAQQLRVSVKTVESYEARIKEKLGVQTAAELMREAVRWYDRTHGF